MINLLIKYWNFLETAQHKKKSSQEITISLNFNVPKLISCVNTVQKLSSIDLSFVTFYL